MQKWFFCISTRLAREMGMTLTQDVTGRQLPLLTAPGLSENLEMVHSSPQGHACQDQLWQPRKTENTGVLAGVAGCERSRKWGYEGSSRLGFKLQVGHHQVQGRQCRARVRDNTGLRGTMQDNESGHCETSRKKRGERTLAGRPWEGATWFWIKNWRSYSAGDRGRPARPSMEYG